MHPATFSQKPRILPHSRRKPHTLAAAPPSTSRNSRSDNPRLACLFPFPFSFQQRFQIRTHRPSTRSSTMFPYSLFLFLRNGLLRKLRIGPQQERNSGIWIRRLRRKTLILTLFFPITISAIFFLILNSQIGSSDVEMDSEVRFRMIHRKRGKSF